MYCGINGALCYKNKLQELFFVCVYIYINIYINSVVLNFFPWLFCT